MKTFLPFALILTIFLAVPSGVYAKKKGKEQPESTPAPADPSNPVAALSPFIINLDGLLALNRAAKSTQAFAAEASGHLLVLRQEFVGQLEQAPAEKKPLFTAAIKTTDLIGAALQDRDRVLGNLGTSRAIAPEGKLQEPASKDNLEQGIKGGGLAKAVGGIVERDREKQAIAKGEAQNAANGKALTAMASNQWNQRAAAWHDQIAAAYSEIK
jgi:hypothetical protein